MIVGIGTDIVEIKRIELAVSKESFLKYCFTEDEILRYKTIKHRVPSIAADFAAKEAVVKAMGTGFRGFTLLDIQIGRNEDGKPYICTSGKCAEICKEKGIEYIHVSLSHCKEYASAFAVAEGKEKPDGI